MEGYTLSRNILQLVTAIFGHCPKLTYVSGTDNLCFYFCMSAALTGKVHEKLAKRLGVTMKCLAYLGGSKTVGEALDHDYLATSDEIFAFAKAAKICVAIVDQGGITLYNRGDAESDVIWVALESYHFTLLHPTGSVDLEQISGVPTKEWPAAKIFTDYSLLSKIVAPLGKLKDKITSSLRPCDVVYYEDRTKKRVRAKCTSCGKFILTIRLQGRDAMVTGKLPHLKTCKYQFTAEPIIEDIE
ncbi:hypothetical protein ADUPG1_013172 [Aduncisulcus paluster]|uniref:Uncharacterized protein n=1 Tax=Aduncisulcus paluster TaxID=2918883 RepID=A0ABQ5K215_9EUKA|nr:hypothetical protein ADUPG1_013172 [Aduncisulcus paluster]